MTDKPTLQSHTHCQVAQADTSALEKEIDAMVYAPYGLSDDEIKLIEGE